MPPNSKETSTPSGNDSEVEIAIANKDLGHLYSLRPTWFLPKPGMIDPLEIVRRQAPLSS